MSSFIYGGLHSTDSNSTYKHPDQAIDLINGKLKPFLPQMERMVLEESLRGVESGGFMTMVFDLARQIEQMPKTYETDGQGNQAIAHLHYFGGPVDAWITELDSNPDQNQAFGKITMTGDQQDAEWGYISIAELTRHGIELDLYWTPKPMFEVLSETPDRVATNPSLSI